MTDSTRASARHLTQLAHTQAGYFTAKQAAAVGYSYPQLVYHVTAGNFARVAQGLYRLASVPVSEFDDLVRLALWSRNQQDEPQAVVSNQSALVLHGLSELLPAETHLTVPPKFRKPAPPGVVLHKSVLSPADTEEREGFRVTTPLRTLLDVAAGGVSQEQLEKAVVDALARGLVRRTVLAENVRSTPYADRFTHALRKKAAR